MNYIFVAVGLAGLFLGGELLVRGSVAVARLMAVSPLLIGLTVVGFGTSTPELLVSLDAALRGMPDIAIGNVVGSNIANVLLIVGISALIWPIAIERGTLPRDISVMIAASLALVLFFLAGELGRMGGLVLFAALVAYLVWAYRQSGKETGESEPLAPAMRAWPALALVASGLVILLVGARLLVDGSVSIARSFGISEAFIGLTIVAVGTSLPELATSLVAAFRRQSAIAIGNVVGSNIFNVFGILGLTAMVAPIPVAPRFAMFDLPVMIGASLVLAGLLLARPVIGRSVAVPMLIAYAVYVWAAQG